MNIVYLISIYMAGVFMFLSPCIFPVIPIYLGILAKDGKKVINTIAFLSGLSFVFIGLGYGFSTIISYIYTDITRTIFSIIVIIFGLQQLGIFNIDFLNKTKLVSVKSDYKNSTLSSFIIGFSFSLGWTPCIGPILATILATAGDTNSVVYTIFLMSIFVLGFVTPFVLFSVFYNKIHNKIGFIKNNLEIIKKISGLLIIFLGISLLLNVIPTSF